MLGDPSEATLFDEVRHNKRGAARAHLVRGATWVGFPSGGVGICGKLASFVHVFLLFTVRMLRLKDAEV